MNIITLFKVFFTLTFSVITGSTIFQPMAVVGNSMSPSYKDGQYIMVVEVDSTKDSYKRGDVVVYKSKNDFSFIHRIVGMPGDKFTIKNDKVYINNEDLEENYLPKDILTTGGTTISVNQEIIIPEKNYILLGDNRPHAHDSRFTGFVSYEDLVGKVSYCYWNCN